jgi:hypothetical protein
MQLKPLPWHDPCCMAWIQVLERGRRAKPTKESNELVGSDVS